MIKLQRHVRRRDHKRAAYRDRLMPPKRDPELQGLRDRYAALQQRYMALELKEKQTRVRASKAEALAKDLDKMVRNPDGPAVAELEKTMEANTELERSVHIMQEQLQQEISTREQLEEELLVSGRNTAASRAEVEEQQSRLVTSLRESELRATAAVDDVLSVRARCRQLEEELETIRQSSQVEIEEHQRGLEDAFADERGQLLREAEERARAKAVALMELDHSWVQLQKELKEVKADNASQANQLAEKANRIRALETVEEDLNDRLYKQEVELEQARLGAACAKTEAGEVKVQRELALEDLIELESRVRELTEEVAAADASTKEACDDLLTANLNHQQEMEEVATELQTAVNELELARESNDQMKTEHQDTLATLAEEHGAAINELTSERDDLLAELAIVKDAKERTEEAWAQDREETAEETQKQLAILEERHHVEHNLMMQRLTECQAREVQAHVDSDVVTGLLQQTKNALAQEKKEARLLHLELADAKDALAAARARTTDQETAPLGEWDTEQASEHMPHAEAGPRTIEVLQRQLNDSRTTIDILRGRLDEERARQDNMLETVQEHFGTEVQVLRAALQKVDQAMQDSAELNIGAIWTKSTALENAQHELSELRESAQRDLSAQHAQQAHEISVLQEELGRKQEKHELELERLRQSLQHKTAVADKLGKELGTQSRLLVDIQAQIHVFEELMAQGDHIGEQFLQEVAETMLGSRVEVDDAMRLARTAVRQTLHGDGSGEPDELYTMALELERRDDIIHRLTGMLQNTMETKILDNSILQPGAQAAELRSDTGADCCTCGKPLASQPGSDETESRLAALSKRLKAQQNFLAAELQNEEVSKDGGAAPGEVASGQIDLLQTRLQVAHRLLEEKDQEGCVLASQVAEYKQSLSHLQHQLVEKSSMLSQTEDALQQALRLARRSASLVFQQEQRQPSSPSEQRPSFAPYEQHTLDSTFAPETSLYSSAGSPLDRSTAADATVPHYVRLPPSRDSTGTYDRSTLDVALKNARVISEIPLSERPDLYSRRSPRVSFTQLLHEPSDVPTRETSLPAQASAVLEHARALVAKEPMRADASAVLEHARALVARVTADTDAVDDAVAAISASDSGAASTAPEPPAMSTDTTELNELETQPEQEKPSPGLEDGQVEQTA